MRKYFKFIPLALVAVVGFSLLSTSSCDGGSAPANQAEQGQVQDQQGIYGTNQPVPTYKWSNERQALIQIYNQRVEGNLSTWTVWYSNNGIPLGSCASKGYPIPYGTELTNPQQVQWDTAGSSGVASGVVGQMDPNGLYPTNNSLGDFILCLDSSGSAHAMFVEPMIVTYPYPVVVRNGEVVQTGDWTTGSAIQLGQPGKP